MGFRVGVIYRENGKEHGNYLYIGLIFRDDGRENGNYGDSIIMRRRLLKLTTLQQEQY